MSCSFVLDSQQSLLSSHRVVANSIPSVEKMIDNYEISSKSVTRAEDQQQEQMISALCKLIGSIATRKNPIVLFLDGKIMCLSRDSNSSSSRNLTSTWSSLRFALGR